MYNKIIMRLIYAIILFSSGIPIQLIGAAEPATPEQRIIKIVNTVDLIENNFLQMVKPLSELGKPIPRETQEKILAIRELLWLYKMVSFQNSRLSFVIMLEQQTNELEQYFTSPETLDTLDKLNQSAIQEHKQLKARQQKAARLTRATPSKKRAHHLMPLTTAEFQLPAITPSPHKSETTTSMIDTKENRFSFFAIFEGHNGSAVPNHLKNVMGKRYLEVLQQIEGSDKKTIIEALRLLIIKTDEEILADQALATSGSSALIAIIDKLYKKLYLINLGISRAILVQQDTTFTTEQLTSPHHVKNPNEQQRITDAGGRIYNNLLWGTSPITRSLGDKFLKIIPGKTIEDTIDIRSVMSEPSMYVHTLQPDDAFLIIASSTLWRKVSNDQAGAIIASSTQESLEVATKKLVQQARDRGADGSLSAMTVRLQ